jgi:predicted acyltransferase
MARAATEVATVQVASVRQDGSQTPGKAERLVSLDQFRGYTVFGMLLVNYMGNYTVCPYILKHTHDHISYADTIMPQFLFAVGFAMRLTYPRRLEREGKGAATLRMVRRLLGLILVSVIIANVAQRAESWQQLTEMGVWGALAEPLKRQWFQTLTHIAVTSLWILPVLQQSVAVRCGWMLISAALHVGLSYWFSFEWTHTPPFGIDGGPFGFLTWSIPALVGTLACDGFTSTQGKVVHFERIGRACSWACLLMLAGYCMSCGTRLYDLPVAGDVIGAGKIAADPVWPDRERIERKQAEGHWSAWVAEAPFVGPPDPTLRQWNYWMMCQRAGTLSYLTFAAGFSLLVFVLFFVLCDVLGFHSQIFLILGTNALLAYILHDMVSNAIGPFVPKDSPAWYVYSSLLLFYFINLLMLGSCRRQGLFLRV